MVECDGLDIPIKWLEIVPKTFHEEWLTGVKAPGTETRITFLPANSFDASYTWGIPQAVGSGSVIGAHLNL